MRKYLWITMVVGAMLFASCKKEPYYHSMSIKYPLGMKFLFADQSLDSVVFYTTDKFQVTSNVSWAFINAEDAVGNIQNTYRNIWEVPVPLHFEANTEGKLRSAEISVRSWGDDDWDNMAKVNFTQCHWLDIYMPYPEYSWNNNIQSDAKFEATDSATQIADTLKFYVYNRWTLTDGKFVHPQQISGEAGENTVVLQIDRNEADKREDEIVLKTDNGASSTIKIIQTAKK